MTHRPCDAQAVHCDKEGVEQCPICKRWFCVGHIHVGHVHEPWDKKEVPQISSGAFTPRSLQATGKIPPGYEVVPDGTDIAPGRIGSGFGGEALVCLLPSDDGQWFRDLCQAKDPEWGVYTYTRKVGGS